MHRPCCSIVGAFYHKL